MYKTSVNAVGQRPSVPVWSMVLIVIVLIMSLLLPQMTHSQVVMATGGGTAKGGNHTVVWTIGQSVTGSGSNGITSFNLGYWAGYLDYTLSEPEIISAPSAVTVDVGDTAILTVTCIGDSIDFQWYKEAAVVKDTGRFTGTLTGSLRIMNAELSDTGFYWVVAGNRAGADTSKKIWLAVGLTGVDDDEDPSLPKMFALRNNYPNPFNPSTKIGFDLPRSCDVSIDIYNILGQRVKTLVSGHLKAGSHLVTWDGRNEAGTQASSGVYFYRIVAGEFVATRRMLLLK